MFYHDEIKSEKLAQEIGVSGASVRSWRSGKQNIYLKNLLKLANYFECSLDFLVGLTENQDIVKVKSCPDFYENLRKVMKEKGISRYYLVHFTDLNDMSFTQWKKGSDVHIDKLIYLAKQLDCSIDHLVGRED